jgi:hypothetical protein
MEPRRACDRCAVHAGGLAVNSERTDCKRCGGKGYRRVAGATYNEPCGCWPPEAKPEGGLTADNSPSSGAREAAGPELSCPSCGYRCHWPVCTKCGRPTPRGPWSLSGAREASPTEQAREKCLCGHPRVSHNREGGGCLWSTCSCGGFEHFLGREASPHAADPTITRERGGSELEIEARRMACEVAYHEFLAEAVAQGFAKPSAYAFRAGWRAGTAYPSPQSTADAMRERP